MSRVKKILVSQPAPASGNSPYKSLAEKYKVTFDFKQFIQVVPLSIPEFCKQRVEILGHTAVIFTTRVAIDYFFHMAKEMRLSIPEDMKYFCKSESVALYLQKYIVYRKRKIFFSANAQDDGLIQIISKHSKERFLAPVAEDHQTGLYDILTENKINFQKAVMYRTISRIFDPKESLDEYDMLIFFTPMGITSLFENYPDFKQGNTLIAATGQQTAKAIEDAGLRLDCSLSNPNAPVLSITSALDNFLALLEKQKNA